jgi:glycosyltransferase involved in cell wall biosynthesis
MESSQMSQSNPETPQKVLMIGDVYRRIQPNHRFFHVVDHVAAHVGEVDFISYENPYGGPPTGFLKKTLVSIWNLLIDRRQITRENNITYIIIRKPKLPQVLHNLLIDVWAYLNLPGWLRRKQYDLCIYSHPHNVNLVSILRRRKRFERVIYDDCDYFAGHLDAKGPLSQRVMAWKEHLSMTRSDGVLSVSDSLAQLRTRQGARRVLVVPNGVHVKNFEAARQKEPHPPTLIYTGSIMDVWGIDNAIRALPLIQKDVPDIRFLVVGDGDYLPALQALARKLALEDVVQFLGVKPHHELFKYIQQADIGIATYRYRQFVAYASSLKIRDYVAAGLPMIASNVGEVGVFVRASGAGEVVDGTPESIAAAAVKMLRDPDLLATYSRNALNYAPSVDWDAVLAPVMDFVTED